MLELFIVAGAVFFGGIYLFKFLFFLLGLLLSGVGFAIKALITIVLGIVFFPVIMVLAGGLLSGGLVVFILAGALISALSRKNARQSAYY
ncbi:hypothetical protein [Spirochaeta isovalerica]|uniref:Uncharacterized protein n=1 Tax=Spirochaeta isovalerica TaxID=150 RepID=A0A841R6N0_9SPIO|nr:hypothetical protein [Spirochaeta isovalerica]MBB6478649.1 hypothetical protein [Spirochaeta isovalerica]